MLRAPTLPPRAALAIAKLCNEDEDEEDDGNATDAEICCTSVKPVNVLEDAGALRAGADGLHADSAGCSTAMISQFEGDARTSYT